MQYVLSSCISTTRVKDNLSNPKTDIQHKIARLIICFCRLTWICHRLSILTTTTIIYQGISIYIRGITYSNSFLKLHDCVFDSLFQKQKQQLIYKQMDQYC